MNDGALVSLGSASMILHYAGKPNGKSHSIFLGFWAITITCA